MVSVEIAEHNPRLVPYTDGFRAIVRAGKQSDLRAFPGIIGRILTMLLARGPQRDLGRGVSRRRKGDRKRLLSPITSQDLRQAVYAEQSQD